MGNVSRKFACARFILPTSGVGGGKAASRDDNAHVIPYWRPSSSAATYFLTTPRTQPQARPVSSKTLPPSTPSPPPTGLPTLFGKIVIALPQQHKKRPKEK